MSPARRNAAFDSFNEIATVRIELRDSDPVIWRQVEVPTSITLKALHNVIQAVMGWFDYHLWEFTIGERRYGLPTDEDWGTEPRIDAAADPNHPDHAEAKEWLDDYVLDTFDELPIKYTLGRIANQRNAAKARLAKKKPPATTG